MADETKEFINQQKKLFIKINTEALRDIGKVIINLIQLCQLLTKAVTINYFQNLDP